MNPRLRALLERKTKAMAAAKAITDKAASENNRDLSTEEAAAFDAHLAEIDRLKGDIGREEALIAHERTTVTIPAGSAARVTERIEEDPRRGFRTYGEFCMSVMAAGVGRALDPRLAMIATLGLGGPNAAATTFGSEASGADGGWAVPPEYSTVIFDKALGDDSLVPLSDGYPVQGNSMTFPTDEGTPWGTTGARAFWENEAAQAAQQKPKIDGPLALRLSKLMALVPITDELAADAVALDRWISGKTAESIRWKTNLAFFQGTGVGQPLGFFGAACAVVVAAEGGQTAGTVVAANVAKMYARCLGRNRAIWMINDDVLPQIMQLSLGNNLLWTPPTSGFKEAPAGMLLGRPIMVTQLCKSIGTSGDINFVNWGAYRSITKAGSGVETAMSMHLYFDQGISAFRATYRIDGKPILRAAVNPANGANTLSPMVSLAAR